jgi:hypothetical protein
VLRQVQGALLLSRQVWRLLPELKLLFSSFSFPLKFFVQRVLAFKVAGNQSSLRTGANLMFKKKRSA